MQQASSGVDVGPFQVLDVSSADLVRHVVGLAIEEPNRPVTAFALHVGGLNHRGNIDFVAAMHDADVVYADGGGVVWLARLAGATRVERASTTDVGWDILHAFAAELGRPPRVALVGGSPGLAERAGAALAEAGAARVVATEHGYHANWEATLQRVSESRPDVMLVGLGAPNEMVWAQRWHDALPPGLILTCGGWFGFLAGDERRAPTFLRRPGLEWIARVAQAPKRLGPRYANGLLSITLMARAALQERREAQ